MSWRLWPRQSKRSDVVPAPRNNRDCRRTQIVFVALPGRQRNSAPAKANAGGQSLRPTRFATNPDHPFTTFSLCRGHGG